MKSKDRTTSAWTCDIPGKLHRPFSRASDAHQIVYIDKYPVTNAEFKRFWNTAHYHPKDDLNFSARLERRCLSIRLGQRPVTWVSIEDARTYADWAGSACLTNGSGIMPAQGADGRIYPWATNGTQTAVPAPDKNRTMRGPDPVDAHPKGASAFGVMDLVGNVLAMDGSFTDEHTRSGILRGGSYYQPQGSIWYFPQAYNSSSTATADDVSQHGSFGRSRFSCRARLRDEFFLARNAIRCSYMPCLP